MRCPVRLLPNPSERTARSLFAVAGLVLAAGTPALGQATLEFLGTPSGLSDSRANDLSEDGSTVVGFTKDGVGTAANGAQYALLQAWVWTSDGGLRPLPSLGANDIRRSEAEAVNADGSVIVGHVTGPSGTSEVYPVVWTRQPDGSYTVEQLPLPAGVGPGFGQQPYAITPDASIIAGEIGGDPAVWLRGPSGYEANVLPTLRVGPGEINAVSADGSRFAGQAKVDGAFGTSAFTTLSAGFDDELTRVGNGADFNGRVHDLSADGGVAAGYTGFLAGNTQAFVYRTDIDEITYIPFLPKENTSVGDFSYAYAITGDGSVAVGQSLVGRSGSTNLYAAFVYFLDPAAETPLVRLSELLESQGVTLEPGRRLVSANAVTTDPAGTVTVAGWSRAGGDLEAFRASFAGPRPRCDIDRDSSGAVDVFDLIEFLVAFSSLYPSANVDGVPGVDIFDLIAYLVAFAEGC